jgi:hypothetical protein
VSGLIIQVTWSSGVRFPLSALRFGFLYLSKGASPKRNRWHMRQYPSTDVKQSPRGCTRDGLGIRRFLGWRSVFWFGLGGA